MAKSLDALFKEIDHFAGEHNHEQVLSLSEKILSVDPKDVDALKCKVVSLLHLDNYDEALTTIEKSSLDIFGFEQAYCLYRQKKYEQSYKIVSVMPKPKPEKVLHLEAQLCYRMDTFVQSISIYEQIFNESQSPSAEMKANFVAAFCASEKNWNQGMKFLNSTKSSLKDSFEFAYNAACLCIEAGDVASAEQYLDLALQTGNAALQKEGMNELEIFAETAVMQAQFGYVLQVAGKTEKALEIYNNILKNKPNDEVMAVVSNNIATLKHEHHLFDTFKKLKHATSQTLDQKLTLQQKKSIIFNRCLLCLKMGKTEECKELCKILDQQFPNSDRSALIHSAIAWKEKQMESAEKLLEEFIAKNPTENQKVQFNLVALYMSKGQPKQAVSILEKVVASSSNSTYTQYLISLCAYAGETEKAAAVFDKYVSQAEAQLKPDQFLKLLKQNAKFKMTHKLYKEAAATFDKILKLNPNDLEALPGAILAWAQVDPKVAEKYESRLPKLNVTAPVEVDVAALEAMSISVKPVAAPKEVVVEAPKQEVVEKKKRKRNRPKPKNMDAKLDPERWIPLKDRSYYRKKNKNKRNQTNQYEKSQGVADANLKNVEKSASEPKPQQSSSNSNKNKNKNKGKRR